MQYTVAFDAPAGQDLSFGLVFIPHCAWKKGETILWESDGALGLGYTRGAILELLLLTEMQPRTRCCLVAAHSDGGGTQHDLYALLADLEEAGFMPAVMVCEASGPAFLVQEEPEPLSSGD
jgi:hypothetical protein